jgi:putative ABC transport system permease protein
MAMTDFTIIRRSMAARLFSTVTTVLTVAVAVALMLILLSMKDSGQRSFERGSGNMHMLVSADNSPLTSVLNGVFYANPPARPIPWTRFSHIASDPRIVGIPGDASIEGGFAIPTVQGDSYRGFPVLATTPEFFTRFRPDPVVAWKFAGGRGFEKNWEVVLGAGAARGTGLKVGDTMHLTHGRSAGSAEEGAHAAHVHDEFPHTVVGILEPTGSSHDRGIFTDLESSWIIHAAERIEAAIIAEEGDDHHHDHEHPAPTAADLIDADRKITGIYIRCVTRAGSDASAVMPSVAAELRSDLTLTVADPASEIKRLFRIVGSVNQILVGMAAVVMVSSGIAIMLALYNSMEQRRRQIAVLRVLGCSRGRVFGLIVTESALLGVIGVGCGLLLGVVGGWGVAAGLKQQLGLVVTPSLVLQWVLAVGMGTVILASVAGVVPAVMAYRTSVAKNLRPIG